MPTPLRPSFPFARRSRRAAALALLALPLGLAFAHRPAAAQDDSPAPARARRQGAFAVPMAVDWKFTSQNVPNNPASPVITADTAYLAEGNRIYAVDLATGAQKWKYPTDTPLQTPIQGSPTFNNGTLYFGTGEGLYALDGATGKQKWQPYLVKSGLATSPVMLDNGVYFASQQGGFYGINAETGDTLAGVYRQSARNVVKTGGDIVGDMTVTDGTAYYVTANNQALHAVDLATGTQRWAVRLPNVPTNNAVPVISGDSLLLASGNLLMNFRRSNGALLWQRPFDVEVASQPTTDPDGNVYVITTDRKIYALDTRNKGLWRKAPQLDYELTQTGPPVFANGLLIVGTASGALNAFDPATGDLKWNYAISPSSSNAATLLATTNISTHPIVSGDTLYVQTDDGTLTAFRHDATDTLAPIITAIAPESGDYVSGRPPFRIAARVEDEGSGLNLSTLKLMLDDKAIPRRPPVDASRPGADTDLPGFVYSPEDNSIEYATQESESGRSTALADGHHSITLTVSDWKGNTATRTWSFTVDDTIPRRGRRAGGGTFTGGRGGAGGAGGGKGFGGSGGGGRGAGGD